MNSSLSKYHHADAMVLGMKKDYDEWHPTEIPGGGHQLWCRLNPLHLLQLCSGTGDHTANNNDII